MNAIHWMRNARPVNRAKSQRPEVVAVKGLLIVGSALERAANARGGKDYLVAFYVRLACQDGMRQSSLLRPQPQNRVGYECGQEER